MPLYEYGHADAADGAACAWGEEFEIEQGYKDDRLAVCPNCGKPVKRLISRTFVSTPRTNTELRDMGFTKLVKKETGVYENVTRRGNDARYMEAGKADTVPDIKKIISD